MWIPLFVYYNHYTTSTILTKVIILTHRYHEGFLGQRIGPVLSLAFHPFRMQLAMGAADNVISVYSGISEARY